jgi:hypothetical protein
MEAHMIDLVKELLLKTRTGGAGVVVADLLSYSGIHYVLMALVEEVVF